MSTIILYDKYEKEFNSLGIGPLVEAISPLATRERNGSYTLTFKYPVNSMLFKSIKLGNWVVSDAGPTLVAQRQRFEIAQITKPINGVVTVYCEHYRYALSRSIVKIGALYYKTSAQAALELLKNQIEPKNDFTFVSDVATIASFDLTDPSKFDSAQSALGGVQGSILDNFGGEYVFNNNKVSLLSKAGKDTNVVIAYGKNITDIEQNESIESTYTSVYGFAKKNDSSGGVITLSEVYIDSEYVENYSQRRVKMVDFSDKNPADSAALRNLVKQYITTNKVGIPKVSIKTKYVDLASSVMSDELKNLEILDLCDWVTIAFNELNINASAQIVKTVWDVTLDRYDSMELGEARTDFATAIANLIPSAELTKNKIDWLEQAQKESSDIIKNPGKGHVVIYPSIADPQEILIMDTMNVNTARKIWRWNAGGLGFSSTGYNGTYGLAMTNDGSIVADRVTSGTLKAINILGVTISGSSFDTTGDYGKILINGGTMQFMDKYGKKFGGFYPANQGSDSLTMIMESDGNLSISSGKNRPKNTNISFGSGYQSENPVTSLTAEQMPLWFHYTQNKSVMTGVEIGNSTVLVRGALQVNNNTPVNFYSGLDMHGYPIYNQSDIRLKEKIENPSFSGIKETKRIQMAEFDFKQNYDNTEIGQQRSTQRQFGIIAQSTPFLSKIIDKNKNNYLSIDLNKQVNLNTLTNKELIEKIEILEKTIISSKKTNRKFPKRKGIKWRTKH